MTCIKHNLQMLALVWHSRVGTPEHARLLMQMKACRKCDLTNPNVAP